MEKDIISQHKLLTDYSKKAQVKKIIIGWIIFLALFFITRIPEVQVLILQYAGKSNANFIINGLVYVFIPMIIGTVVTYREKHHFDGLCFYNTGIGFINTKNNTQYYADYKDIELSYGKMQQSFYIKSVSANIKEHEYAWNEFDHPDVLRNNLERYGTIR